VSRQREWLADASAVQFTRQTTGLAGALKKIAGMPEGSQLRDTHSEKQINHMLFGEGARGISQLLATHPPLLDRIVALEPTFDVDAVRALQDHYAEQRPDGLAEDAQLGLAGAPMPGRPVPPPHTARVEPTAVRERVATLSRDDLAVGARINAMIPEQLRTAASQQGTAVPLVLAMLLDPHEDVGAVQAQIIRGRLGATTAAEAARFYPAVAHLDPILRLPIVSIAAALLAARPRPEQQALVTTLDELARADDVITVFEYSLTRLVGAYLLDAGDPLPRSRPGRARVETVRDAALTLLAVVSAAGNPDPVAAEHAFTTAAAHLLPGATVRYAPPAQPWRALDAGWEPLNSLDPRNKQVLVEALVLAVADDGVLAAAEAELLRTTCAMLRCPLPPLLG
jgi:hypothetical protein